jgi:hypothetical protein
MRLFVHHRRRNVTASLTLALLLFRAYVPLGFMPASGSPFELEICPQGLQLQAPVHRLHGQTGHSHVPEGHTYFANCPFGSAPAAGPITHLIGVEPAGPIDAQALPEPPLRWGVPLKRAHRARAPPIPA